MTIKAVFFGTPEFVMPTLEELRDNPGVEIKFIVSMPDRPAGRGQLLHSPQPILFAKEHNIPFFQTDNINNESDFLKTLSSQKIDVFIVLAFAQFFKQHVLSLPLLGCFNIHTSLLPKYRGSSPIQFALLNGDKQTGVSIQKMVKKMDAGDICIQRAIIIEEEDNTQSLSKKLSEESARATNELVKKISTNSLSFTAQDEENVSFTKIIKKEDGFLNFKSETAKTLVRKFKAYFPWPGSFCFLDNQRLKITQLKIEPNVQVAPGEYVFNNSKFFVGCLEGTLRLETVQIEGKKAGPDNIFINGVKSKNWLFKINP